MKIEGDVEELVIERLRVPGSLAPGSLTLREDGFIHVKLYITDDGAVRILELV